MSTENRPEHSTAYANGKRTSLLRVLERIVIAAAVIGIAIVGFSAVSAWRELLAPAPKAEAPVSDPTVASSAPVPFHHDLASVLKSGFWQTAAGSTAIGIRQVDADDLETAIEEFLATAAQFDGSALDAQASASLLAAIRDKATVTRLPMGHSLYAVGQGSDRIALVSMGEGATERIVAGFAALHSEADNRWTLLEMLPALQTASANEYTHLLPLPADAVRECARTDLQGRITLELVCISTPFDTQVENWTAAGWSMRPVAAGAEGVAPATEGYVCSRADSIVYVFPLLEQNKSRLLMLNMSALSASYLASGSKP